MPFFARGSRVSDEDIEAFNRHHAATRRTVQAYNPLASGGYGGLAETSDAMGGTWLGVPGSPDGDDREVQRYRDLAGRSTASAPTLDQSDAKLARVRQLQAYYRALEAAQGNRPSQAVMLGRRNVADAQAAQLSMANTARGGAGARAAAGRMARMQSASIGALGRLQEQATRADEMATAREQVAQIAGQLRAQDIGVSSEQARLEMEQRARNAQREQFFEGLAQQTRKSRMGAELGQRASDYAMEHGRVMQGLRESEASWDRTKQMIGMATGAISGGLSAYGQVQGASAPQEQARMSPDERRRFDLDVYYSDVRTKADVTPVSGDPMASALRSMSASQYQYRPEYTPPGEEPGAIHVGPMANEMAKDPIARTAIVRDPSTGLLAIDRDRSLKLALGGLASLQRQVDELKRQKATRG